VAFLLAVAVVVLLVAVSQGHWLYSDFTIYCYHDALGTGVTLSLPFGMRRNCLKRGRSRLQYLSTRREIKHIVITIGV
jgi:hypothetical protein